MNDALTVVIGILIYMFGILCGAALSADTLNSDCRNHQKHMTEKYILTCEAKK